MALVASAAAGTVVGIEVAILVPKGDDIAVYVGFGIFEYAQRFSWVGVTVLKMEALAGEDVIANTVSPPQSNRHRLSRSGKRLCLSDGMAFMERDSEWQLVLRFRYWQNTKYQRRLLLRRGPFVV